MPSERSVTEASVVPRNFHSRRHARRTASIVPGKIKALYDQRKHARSAKHSTMRPLWDPFFRVKLRTMALLDGESSSMSTAGGFSIPDVDSNGVDRAQIRRQLKLSPGERLRSLESFLASVIRIRRGVRRAQVSRDPHPAR